MDLAAILTIQPAPGRKDAGTPSKQTIRNYIHSIVKECGSYFKVISHGQKLRFFFPELPKVFEEIMQNTEVNIENNSVRAPNSIEIFGDLEQEDNLVPNTEANRLTSVKNNNIYIINKHNKQTTHDQNAIFKKPIAQDFYPTQETISTAIARGHSNVTDLRTIQEFVDKNTAWGSQFADFNPVYLRFLAKDAELKQQSQKLPNRKTRSQYNESSPLKYKSFEEVMEAVRRANPNPRSPSESLFELEPINWETFVPRAHGLALATTDNDLRSVVSHEARTEG